MSAQPKIPTLQELDHILHEAEAALLSIYLNDEPSGADPDGYDEHNELLYIRANGWSHHIKTVQEVLPTGYLCISETGRVLRITFKQTPPEMSLSSVLALIAEAEAR